ncbi:hypothetical protein SY89_01844 [Halolamina pelagica]|uniref:Uncharacterized protein n=1 Tax=Halolamina pelagica TaxID=699431 RepID=A0A0P7FVS6_9EURY|nr:hypothetical protein [Halolamina pelagica]KPN31102.1 hypothetical protein SY89_01844 [Halolamina pelagica]
MVDDLAATLVESENLSQLDECFDLRIVRAGGFGLDLVGSVGARGSP